jgi:type I restriction enzyme S subunit
MNNNTTYKDSPLGKIPSDWEVKRLKEILIEGRLGGNYENAEANNGIPVIKMGNLDRGVIKTDKVQYLPEDNEYNEEDVLKENDLLFNTRNTLELVGKVAIWKNELPLAVYNSNLMRMKFAEKWVQLSSYMNYAFNSHYALSQLKGRATGTTSVAAIYGRDLDSVKFRLPPLPEQTRIAEVLSAWDKAISNVQATIEQVEQRNKWLMQELLTGKRRLEGFSGEWKKVGAGEIFKSITIKGFENEELLSATQDRGIIPRSMLEGRVTMPEGTTAGYKLVEPGDFVISLRSFQGGLEYSYYRGIVSPAYIVLKPKKAINDEFYKQYYKSYEFIGRLATAVIGIRDGKQVSYDDFCVVKIPFPSLEEQTAIAQVLQAASNEVQVLRSKLEKLKEQKKGLMQVLLTGKKRLNLNLQD